MEANQNKAFAEAERSIKHLLERFPKLKDFDRYNLIRGLKIKTRRNHLQTMSLFLKKVKKPFDKITRKDIENFIISIDSYSEHSKSRMKSTLKKFFQWFYNMEGSDYPDLVKWINATIKNNHYKLPSDMLTIKEIFQLANATDNIRDRALIFCLYESACRCGEIINLRVKDVKFDNYGALISVVGKTGQRPVRLINTESTVVALRDLLNNNPFKNNPEAFVFYNKKRSENEGLTEYAIRCMLRRLNKIVKIKKRIHPHLFRHTRLTELAKKGYNETFLKHFAGWTNSSTMPEVYIHASAKDIDDMMLQKEGLLKIEEVKDETLKPIQCRKCGEKNSPTNRFCGKCATALDQESQEEIEYMLKWMDFIRNHKVELRGMMKKEKDSIP